MPSFPITSLISLPSAIQIDRATFVNSVTVNGTLTTARLIVGSATVFGSAGQATFGSVTISSDLVVTGVASVNRLVAASNVEAIIASVNRLVAASNVEAVIGSFNQLAVASLASANQLVIASNAAFGTTINATYTLVTRQSLPVLLGISSTDAATAGMPRMTMTFRATVGSIAKLILHDASGGVHHITLALATDSV